MENPVEILKDLIRIDSQCNLSNKKIVEYIKTKLQRFEIKEFHFINSDLELYNLVIKIHGKKSDHPIIFAGHTDTVPTSPNWTMAPLEPTIKDNKLYGLGSADMKSGLACIIAAALNLKGEPEEDIYILLDADEEASGSGGRELIKEFTITNARVLLAEIGRAHV